MREQLLGYVLGALDPAEQAELEVRLAVDPELRRELEEVRATLVPLDEDDSDPTPPPGMAERTCRSVCSHAGWRPWASASQSESLQTSGNWRAPDVMVAAGIFMAASLLIFPAVSSSVSSSRRLHCENNMRQIGLAMLNYNEHHNDQLPYVPAEGRLGVAGIYAAILNWNGYLQKPSQILCPESATDEQRNFKIPTLEEFNSANRVQLRIYHLYVGGSYCYSFGYIDANDVYRGARNLHRSHHAILADKPGNLAGGDNPNHDKGGNNVMFEDGHVRFQLGSRVYEVGDDIYKRNDGLPGAGIGVDDAVACPSETPPVLYIPVQLQFITR